MYILLRSFFYCWGWPFFVTHVSLLVLCCYYYEIVAIINLSLTLTLLLLFLCCYCYCCCFFGADHQRVPIASNGPAAIRPLLSHLLLGKHDLDKFSSNYFLTFFQFVSSQKQDSDKICNELYLTLKVTKSIIFSLFSLPLQKGDLELRRGITTRIQKLFFKLPNM